jgi:hypothetical protein
MTIRITLALAAAALAVGVPVASATPDGYQPQLSQANPFDRYPLDYSSTEAPSFDSGGAAAHPDSHGVRPGPIAEQEAAAGDGRDWTTGMIGVLGGALLALVAVVGASAIRGRGRLVLG